MADPDKLEEDIEDLLEIGGARDADETEAKEGTVAEADGAEDSTRKRKGRRMLPRVFGLVWRRKWIGLFIMLPLGALIALGITLHSGYLEKQKVKPLPLSGKAVSLESLKEESLSPFFIPLTADDNRRMVRVDLSVIWSALASIKYKKMKYGYVTGCTVF